MGREVDLSKNTKTSNIYLYGSIYNDLIYDRQIQVIRVHAIITLNLTKQEGIWYKNVILS